MARPQAFGTQDRLTLDSGAVIALARRDARARAYLQRSLELDTEVQIPAVVVAETLRGGPRDAPVQQVLKMIGNVVPTTETQARLAGALLGKARSNATIDALVVACAIEQGESTILTGDFDDLSRLADDRSTIWVQRL